MQFNSFNNGFNKQQKFTSNQIISPNNELYFHDIYGNYANINVTNNSARQNGIVDANRKIIADAKRNQEQTNINLSIS